MHAACYQKPARLQEYYRPADYDSLIPLSAYHIHMSVTGPVEGRGTRYNCIPLHFFTPPSQVHGDVGCMAVFVCPVTAKSGKKIRRLCARASGATPPQEAARRGPGAPSGLPSAGPTRGPFGPRPIAPLSRRARGSPSPGRSCPGRRTTKTTPCRT